MIKEERVMAHGGGRHGGGHGGGFGGGHHHGHHHRRHYYGRGCCAFLLGVPMLVALAVITVIILF